MGAAWSGCCWEMSILQRKTFSAPESWATTTRIRIADVQETPYLCATLGNAAIWSRRTGDRERFTSSHAFVALPSLVHVECRLNGTTRTAHTAGLSHEWFPVVCGTGRVRYTPMQRATLFVKSTPHHLTPCLARSGLPRSPSQGRRSAWVDCSDRPGHNRVGPGSAP